MEFSQTYKGLTQSFEQGVANSDADWIAALFSDDCVLLEPGLEPMQGREAVRAHFQQLFEAFKAETKIEAAESEELGEKGWGRGAWEATLTPKDGGAALQASGKFLECRATAQGRDARDPAALCGGRSAVAALGRGVGKRGCIERREEEATAPRLLRVFTRGC